VAATLLHKYKEISEQSETAIGLFLILPECRPWCYSKDSLPSHLALCF